MRRTPPGVPGKVAPCPRKKWDRLSGVPQGAYFVREWGALRSSTVGVPRERISYGSGVPSVLPTVRVPQGAHFVREWGALRSSYGEGTQGSEAALCFLGEGTTDAFRTGMGHSRTAHVYGMGHTCTLPVDALH